MHKSALIAATVVALAPWANTADARNKTDAWTGEAEFSYLLKRGNTDSDSIVGKANAEYEGESWRHTAEVEGLNTTSENQTTGETERVAERYYLSYKLDRKLGPANYIFNVGTYDKDAFSGFHYRVSYALGYGRSLISTDRHELSAELGPGFRQRCLEPEDSYANCERRQDSGIVRMAGEYRWEISESATFRQKANTEISDEEGSVTRSETTLTSQLNDTLALRLAYLLKHNTRVPKGTEETDHEVTVSLVVGF